MHDSLDYSLGHVLVFKLIDISYHFLIGFPLVLYVFGFTVIDVVLFGKSIQSINARIPSLQSLPQMRTRSHLLIAGAVPFDSRLGKHVLNVESPPLRSRLLFLFRDSPFRRLSSDDFSFRDFFLSLSRCHSHVADLFSVYLL